VRLETIITVKKYK